MNLAVGADGRVFFRFHPDAAWQSERDDDRGSMLNDLVVDDALAAKVERHGPRPTTDGAIAGAEGSVYPAAIAYDASLLPRAP